MSTNFAYSTDDECDIEIDLSQANKNHQQQLLLLAIESYEILLPKQLGCLVCQYTHWFIHSPLYQHVSQRQNELKQLKTLVNSAPYNQREIINFIEQKMGKFNKKASTNFRNQCMLILNPESSRLEHNGSDPQSVPR